MTWLDSKGKVIIGLIALYLITIVYCFYQGFFTSSIEEAKETLQAEFIFVDIAGEVLYPDVYQVQAGTRLFELIELAGGLTEDANVSGLNRTLELSDQMKIIIPSKKNLHEEANYCVNINTASKTELMKLTGIGEVKAQSIIDYRNRFGFFTTPMQIMKVSGIGEKTYEKIQHEICI